MIIIGLTGGIACGKSTVARLIQTELKIPVLDADKISREIVQPGEKGLAEVIARFGDQILQSDGTLNRKKLGTLIMNDEVARQDLMKITHPKIAARIMQKLLQLKQKGHFAAVVEAALMIENKTHKKYHGVLVVSCAAQTQLQRLMSREGFTKPQAEKWISSQFPLSEKEKAADWVIHNDSDLKSLASSLTDGWDAFIKKCAIDTNKQSKNN